MYRFRHMMVALANTAADAGLIRYAAAVARLGTVREVRFIHVLPPAGGPTRSADLDRGAAAGIEAAIRTHFTGVPPEAHARGEVLRGPLVDRLLEFTAEQEMDLVLLGHRRDHPGRRSLARRLAMKAPCSVWMVPDGSPNTLDRILVPIDFSDHSADTMKVATAMARQAGAEVVAVHAYFNEARVTFEEYGEVLRGQEEQAFQEFIAGIDCSGVAVRPVFEEGANVAHVIGRVAARERADLVMMATCGRSRSAAILLGSVAEDTIIDTKVPLLAVKHFGARMGLLEALFDRSFRRRRNPQFD